MLFDHQGLMAHLQINNNIGWGGIFALGQLLTFGSIVLHADPSNHLGRMENFAPNQVITFERLEYSTDAPRDLVLSGGPRISTSPPAS